MTATMPLRAFLLDDEPLAVQRLARLLAEIDDVKIAGSATDPASALDWLSREPVDVLFLDIQMPGMNGFELLARLPDQPWIIFTTAYDEYALQAFEVNSIDYLLKPIAADQLKRALGKLQRLRDAPKPDWMRSPELRALLDDLSASLRMSRPEYPRRIASRVGDRISFVDLDTVTHFFARDKLTYAASAGHKHCVDESISELERRLDPSRFVRVHRAVLLNLDWVQEVNSRFAGRVSVSLKDAQNTRLPVARDRVRELKKRLGF